MKRNRLIVIGALGVLIAIAVGLVLSLGNGSSSTPKSSTIGEIVATDGAKQDSASGQLGRTSAGAPFDASGVEQYAAAPSAPGVGDATQSTLPDILGRKIVQTSDIDVRVKEVPRTFQDIVRIATGAGGFVASSTFSNADNKQQIADLTIRVPADQYQSVLAQVRGMGDVAQEKSDANDVTEEYTDLQARVRTLQATEQRYLDLLARAESVNDILTVQDRLDSVRTQIEQVQGRINLLDHLTDLATITVHLRPLAAAANASTGGGPHPIAAAESAWAHSLDALRGVASAALVVAVFSWWLVPPLAALAWFGRWWMNRRPRPIEQGAA